MQPTFEPADFEKTLIFPRSFQHQIFKLRPAWRESPIWPLFPNKVGVVDKIQRFERRYSAPIPSVHEIEVCRFSFTAKAGTRPVAKHKSTQVSVKWSTRADALPGRLICTPPCTNPCQSPLPKVRFTARGNTQSELRRVVRISRVKGSSSGIVFAVSTWAICTVRLDVLLAEYRWY